MCIRDSGGYGVKVTGGQYGMVLVNSLVRDNNKGVWFSNYSYSISYIIGCVVDGNTSNGIELGSSGIHSIYNTRITGNGGAGISVSGTGGHIINQCVMPGSGQDRENGSANVLGNAVLFDCDFAITDTDAGYVDPSAGNFQLASTATKRSVSVSVDANTTMYSTSGITPDASGGGGGSSVIVIEE